MQLRVKTKLNLGLGFLSLVIILIGSLGAFYIYRIANESKEILKDNYESIQYSKSMMQSIDGLDNNTSLFFTNFEKHLMLQESNITEIGEKELTQTLRNQFNTIRVKGINQRALVEIKKSLYSISDLNMQAILRKNNSVQSSADRVLTYIGIIGAICFIMVFAFIIKFPGYIADPIKQLTESIKQIAGKNYHQRLHFKSNDEFGELAKAFNSMAEKLEHYESSNLAKIMFEKKRIETIINSMKDAIIGLSEKRIILFANIQAVQLMGLDEKDLIGKYAPDVAIANDLMRLLLGESSDNKSLKIVTEGKENYFSKEILLILSDGHSIGEVILLKNITEFQELDLAKTNFIATISHELKTPIASIKLSSKLLEDNRIGALNEEQRQLVKNIKDDSERLLKISSEVLNMAQVETGRIQLNFQKIKSEDIINYAVNSLRFQAEQKHVTLQMEIEADLPFMDADLEKTAWVMVNLLSNAIRYSPENDKIIIRAARANNQVEFSVQDNGKGIDPRYQNRIFDKFFHIPGNPKHGTGLGLAIAKEFILAQNGQIGLSSSVGEGTRFYFKLPAVFN